MTAIFSADASLYRKSCWSTPPDPVRAADGRGHARRVTDGDVSPRSFGKNCGLPRFVPQVLRYHASIGRASFMISQPYPYTRYELAEPDWRRFPGWAGVSEEDWASAQWQRAHCVKNIRQLGQVTGP